MTEQAPTQRELDNLRIQRANDECTVREVYDQIPKDLVLAVVPLPRVSWFGGDDAILAASIVSTLVRSMDKAATEDDAFISR